MNLKELKTLVDSQIKHLNSMEPEDVPVLITLSEPSIGSRASTGVSSVGMGFDWEHGQFRFEPAVPLVKKGDSLNDVKSVICKEFDGRNYYVCPQCLQRITKDDFYCRYCGKKLR